MFSSDYVSETKSVQYITVTNDYFVTTQYEKNCESLYLRYPLFCSFSANDFTEDIRRSSQPRKYSRKNWPIESPKHLCRVGSSGTNITGMPNRFLALGDKRKNPYSNEYSTM